MFLRVAKNKSHHVSTHKNKIKVVKKLSRIYDTKTCLNSENFWK